ncbi:MAG: helix-turn-helix domain-containing protein [Solirubrobacterales bacterium]
MVSRSDAPTGDGAAEQEAAGSGRAGGGEPGFRIGERTLGILAAPLNVRILRSLGGGPMRLAELRRSTGLPAQTTLRGHLASLGETGLVRKRPTEEMPYSVENSLTPMGRDLLGVAGQLEDWLAEAPGGPLPLDSGGAKGVIKAFIDGWGSTMVQGMAAHPMSLTELDRGIAGLSYPALERRLASLRMAGLIETADSAGIGTPYEVTAWARRGVAPLVAAGHCEAVHLGARAAPPARADVEAAFMLAMPLVRLPPAAVGRCRLEVEPGEKGPSEPVAVTVTFESGRVAACAPGAGAEAEHSAAGPIDAWLVAVGDGAPEQLRLGGEELAERVVRGLRAALLRA